MAKINPNDADKYQSKLNGEWFSLKNDGDVARVQFMLDNYEELDTFTCHRVTLNDKERYVDCPRNYDDPIDMCPLCAAGYPVKPVRFVLMFDHEDQKVKIWERGPQFMTMLQGFMARYSPLSSYVFEVERKGKAGDTNTKYNVYPMDRVEAFDLTEVERPKFLGGLILDKTPDEMDYFLDTGDFPKEDEEPQPPAPVSRRPAPAQRQAPATANRREAPPPPRRAPAAPVAEPLPVAVPPSRHSTPGTGTRPPEVSRSSRPAATAQSTTTEPPLRGPSRTGRKPEVF